MIEVLKYTLPALIVLLAAWMVLYKLLREERERRLLELRKQDRNITIPIMLRGYERLTLLLERTTPEHLLLNCDLQNITATDLQRQLLQTIRLEFDHNVSQQVYVSDEVWAAVVIAKEEMLRFVSETRQQLPAEATALQYANTMMQAYSLNGETPSQQALRLLKAEARKLY
ncbi:MAG: hypothetical protein IJS05_04510 [Paludibacteraceae bacterium]|nr:hypothetical protein [Paludibacteraceae bacterium]